MLAEAAIMVSRRYGMQGVACGRRGENYEQQDRRQKQKQEKENKGQKGEAQERGQADRSCFNG